jgi:hypothetical protein
MAKFNFENLNVHPTFVFYFSKLIFRLVQLHSPYPELQILKIQNYLKHIIAFSGKRKRAR